jgi:hypothetical protein
LEKNKILFIFKTDVCFANHPAFFHFKSETTCQNKILNPVANLIISQGVHKGGSIVVGLKAEKAEKGADKNSDKNGATSATGKSPEFTFEVKKGRKGSIISQMVEKEKAMV